MFNDIFIFIAIVETGSLIGAAKKLNMSQATVSRRLQALEEELGIKLIMRSTRNFELTNAGRTLYEGVKDQQKYLDELVTNLSAKSQKTTGTLKVVLPTVMSYHVISPYLPDFLIKNPEAKLEICYQNRDIDLFRDRIDLAVINHRPTQQTLKIRHLASVAGHFYCTPEYAKKYGLPETLEELEQKHVYAGLLSNNLKPINELEVTNLKTGKVTTKLVNNASIYNNNALHCKPMVLSNKLICGGWDYLFQEELKSGEVIKVLPNYSFGELPFYLVRIQEHNTQLIRTFIDFIDECFGRIVEKK